MIKRFGRYKCSRCREWKHRGSFGYIGAHGKICDGCRLPGGNLTWRSAGRVRPCR